MMRVRQIHVQPTDTVSAINLDHEVRSMAAKTPLSAQHAQHAQPDTKRMLRILRNYDNLLAICGISLRPEWRESKGFVYYGNIYSVVLWLNFMRSCSVFTASEQFNSELFLKIVACTWALLMACQHMVVLESSRRKLLNKDLLVLWDIALTHFNIEARMKTTITFCCVLFGIVLPLTNIIAGIILLFTTDTLDVVLAPFTIYITGYPSYVDILIRITYSVIHSACSVAWTVPLGLPLIFNYGLRSFFSEINKSLTKAIDEDKTLHDQIEEFRLFHQTTCHLSHVTDRIFRLEAGIVMLFMSFHVVLLLFTIIFYDQSNLLFNVAVLYWLLVSFIGVFSLCSVSALMNFAAHFTRHALYRVELDRYGEKERCSYLTFLSRVEGTYVGQSVFGLFVINTTSILTLLTVLLSYFAFTVTLSNVASSNVYTCSCSAVNVNGTFSCLLQSSS